MTPKASTEKIQKITIDAVKLRFVYVKRKLVKITNRVQWSL